MGGENTVHGRSRHQWAWGRGGGELLAGSLGSIAGVGSGGIYLFIIIKKKLKMCICYFYIFLDFYLLFYVFICVERDFFLFRVSLSVFVMLCYSSCCFFL